MCGLDIRVNKYQNNPLLKRRELEITVNHDKTSTPSKKEMAENISSSYSLPASQIYVFGIKTGFGSNESVAYAHIYNSMQDLKDIEKEHVIAKITGEVKSKINRRTKKQEKNKKLKIFGSERRNKMKAKRKTSNK